MRFAIPPPPSRSFRLGRRITDWPLAYRLALIILPSTLIVTLVAIWFGYRAASSSLAESLQDLPMFEAKLQATTMTETLKQLRGSLFKIAQSRREDAQQLRDNMELFFQNNYDLIQELGYKEAGGNTFILVRDKDGFTGLSNGEAPHSPYSPFQQIDTSQLAPGKAKLFPAVFFNDPAPQVGEQMPRTAVMRMALLLPDESATLVIGLNLARLSVRLAGLMAIDSPLRLPSQTDGSQLAFFFDMDGWILFEMLQQESKGRYLPDTARQGYSGDLGRAGYDAAFRPWTGHENYWRMVTDALLGRAGSIQAPADKYMSRNLGEAGLLCFAPVLFAASDNEDPQPVGGIAFFETTMLPLHAFLRVANYSLIILVVSLVFFTLLVWRVSSKFGKPLRLMAKNLAEMTSEEKLAFVDEPPAFAEQQKIQVAVNRIISSAMINHKELERLSLEMQHAKSQLPVLLDQPMEVPRPQEKLGLVGSSSLIEGVRKHVGKAAKAGTDVLIWGETGTGKELVAAAIHKAGARSAGPYISINCGALDENLLLDALFGHVKGAFTEAKEDRKGAFLSANGGTLHLDEIGNASPKVQQALLRALAVRRIRPLGSDAEVPFDTRVVAATNEDLRERARAGTFREDLYYRLAIINIETPPLRHRKEDIPELAAHLIREAALSLGRPEARLSRGALDMITAYDWPGNVRELKNCITRAMAFVEEDIILPEHIVLEQDAYRTYAKPLSADLFSDKMLGDVAGRIARSIYAPSGTDAAAHARAAATESAEADKGFLKGIVSAASSFLPSGGKEKGPSPAPGTLPVFPALAGQKPPYSPFRYPAGHIPGRFTLPPHHPQQGIPHRTFVPPAPPSPFRAPLVPPFPLPAPAAPQARSEQPSEGLNERQARAIELVRREGEFTRAQYEAVAGSDISSRTAQNDLRELVERGILERVGAGPGTRYTLPRSKA